MLVGMIGWEPGVTSSADVILVEQGPNETVGVWLTQGADQSVLLTQQPNLTFASGTPDAYNIVVDETQLFQRIDGMGSALTDSAAWVLYNSPHYLTMMDRLFSKTNGIGMSLVRIVMGASDSARTWYTYNDTPGIQNFSIAHDLAYMIPVAKRALEINPDVKFIASPWSAPGWMKSGNYGPQGLLEGWLNTAHYSNYAQYFVKFLEAYKAQGVPIYAVTIVNEPLYQGPDYPGMYLSAAQQRTFIRDYLGPAIAASQSPETKIISFDHNWADSDYAMTVLADPGAKGFTAGTGFHCYGGDISAQSAVHSAHPDRDIYHTECSSGAWKTWPDAWEGSLGWIVIKGTRHHAKGVNFYNLALNHLGGPALAGGGVTDLWAAIHVNTSNNTFYYNMDYYALGHATKFLKPGAYRIASTDLGSSFLNVAFRNPDGGIVLIVYNLTGATNSFTVQWGSQYISYSLAAKAAATFTWQGPTFAAALSRTGWVASASVNHMTDTPNKAIDANTTTRWSAGVAQAPGQWFKIDMGATRTFDRITMAHPANSWPRGYVVTVSDDNSTWATAAKGAGTGTTSTLYFPNQSKRYIRITSTSSSTATWMITNFNVYSPVGGTVQQPSQPATSPYVNPPPSLPGTVQAENYDLGGQGISFNDTDAINNGGAYRPNEPVDVEDQAGGGYNVGWIATGEWMNYTIMAPTAGNFDVTLYVASPNANTQLHVRFITNGVTTQLPARVIPNTGGWQNWQTVIYTNVSLPSSAQSMRVFSDVGGFNLDKIVITTAGGGGGGFLNMNLRTQLPGNRCLDVPGWSITPGTQVFLYDCNGGTNQQFRHNLTTRELEIYYGASIGGNPPGADKRCLASGAGTDQAIRIQLCAAGADASKRWTLNGSGTISNDEGYCLDVDGAGWGAQGSLLWKYSCNGGLNQLWTW
jgi:glucosylceramidase